MINSNLVELSGDEVESTQAEVVRSQPLTPEMAERWLSDNGMGVAVVVVSPNGGTIPLIDFVSLLPDHLKGWGIHSVIMERKS